MFRSIAHTLGTKFLTVLLQLALLFVTTKLMGASIKGQIGLLILNLTIVSIITGVLGGTAMVYLTPRYRIRDLLLIGYLWSALVAPATAGVLAIAGTSGFPGFSMFLILALAEAALAVHVPVLLGARKVVFYNYTLIVKPLVVVAVLFFLHFSGRELGFYDFLWAYFAGLVTALSFSGLVLARLPTNHRPRIAFVDTLKATFKFGFTVQLGNMAQLLNYRLSLYLLEIFTAPALALFRIGVYSAVLQVGESVLHFARSVAVVQYSEVSNSTDHGRSLRISLQLIKLNYGVTILGSLLLLLLPNSVYIAFLGGDFHEIKAHLYLMVPGMVALSVSTGITHYFSGEGLHHLNTRAAVVGLMIIAAAGTPLIALYGSYGAAAAATLVSAGQMVYLYRRLRSRDKVAMADLRITPADLRTSWQLFGRFLKPKP